MDLYLDFFLSHDLRLATHEDNFSLTIVVLLTVKAVSWGHLFNHSAHWLTHYAKLFLFAVRVYVMIITAQPHEKFSICRLNIITYKQWRTELLPLAKWVIQVYTHGYLCRLQIIYNLNVQAQSCPPWYFHQCFPTLSLNAFSDHITLSRMT